MTKEELNKYYKFIREITKNKEIIFFTAQAPKSRSSNYRPENNKIIIIDYISLLNS